jgi:hypothetical protein
MNVQIYICNKNKTRCEKQKPSDNATSPLAMQQCRITKTSFISREGRAGKANTPISALFLTSNIPSITKVAEENA